MVCSYLLHLVWHHSHFQTAQKNSAYNSGLFIFVALGVTSFSFSNCTEDLGLQLWSVHIYCTWCDIVLIFKLHRRTQLTTLVCSYLLHLVWDHFHFQTAQKISAYNFGLFIFIALGVTSFSFWNCTEELGLQLVLLYTVWKFKWRHTCAINMNRSWFSIF